MSTIYPFPSHVSVQSFVTVKLSDKVMYGLWKKQMLYLLKSHNMLSFINVIRDSKDEDRDLWERSDSLVSGWILGSLSEHTAIKLLDTLNSKLDPQTDFTAKEIWDQVQMMFNRQADRRKEERTRDIQEEEGRKFNENLYLAVASGKPKDLFKLFEDAKVQLTDSISINGNTALHIAAAKSTAKDDILKSMLDRLPENIDLTKVQNLDGSTPLHLAASFGNTNAAKILVAKYPTLLAAKDNEGCTPLDIILSEPLNKETFQFFVDYTMPDIEQDTFASEEPLVHAISHEYFDQANTLIKNYKSLKSDAVLMAIAQHCPADFGPSELFDYEFWPTPILAILTKVLNLKLPNLVLKAGGVLVYPYKMLLSICMNLEVYNHFKENMDKRQDAREILDTVCKLIKISNDACSYKDFYTKAILEAIRRDASDVVEKVVHWFPDAVMIVDADGNNIAQAAWKNRASKVLSLTVDGKMAKHTSLSQKLKGDHYGNNFLHLAARLAPPRKLSPFACPPFHLQRELKWFKLAQKIVPQGRMEKNCFDETPEMVFTKEHKELLLESGNWMKSTANSYAITAILIITGVFTASITIPGGNKENSGVPNFNAKPAFIMLAVSIAISMVTSTMSLLLLMTILASDYSEREFHNRLPVVFVIAFVTLYVSATFTMLAFGAAWFLTFGSKYPWTVGLIAPTIFIPIVFLWDFYSAFLLDFIYSQDVYLLHSLLPLPTLLRNIGFHRPKLLSRIYI